MTPPPSYTFSFNYNNWLLVNQSDIDSVYTTNINYCSGINPPYELNLSFNISNNYLTLTSTYYDSASNPSNSALAFYLNPNSAYIFTQPNKGNSYLSMASDSYSGVADSNSSGIYANCSSSNTTLSISQNLSGSVTTVTVSSGTFTSIVQ
jgi:hypothetical protein